MNSQLTSLPMCGSIAQLVEHRTGIAEVTGSNPVEALIFFKLQDTAMFLHRFVLLYNAVNWRIYVGISSGSAPVLLPSGRAVLFM